MNDLSEIAYYAPEESRSAKGDLKAGIVLLATPFILRAIGLTIAAIVPVWWESTVLEDNIRILWAIQGVSILIAPIGLYTTITAALELNDIMHRKRDVLRQRQGIVR